MISIHAPVKGATRDTLTTLREIEISIHAPVKGATGIIHDSRHRGRYFNPRSREGSDTRLDWECVHPLAFQSTLP